MLFFQAVEYASSSFDSSLQLYAGVAWPRSHTAKAY